MLLLYEDQIRLLKILHLEAGGLRFHVSLCAFGGTTRFTAEFSESPYTRFNLTEATIVYFNTR